MGRGHRAGWRVGGRTAASTIIHSAQCVEATGDEMSTECGERHSCELHTKLYNMALNRKHERIGIRYRFSVELCKIQIDYDYSLVSEMKGQFMLTNISCNVFSLFMR